MTWLENFAGSISPSFSQHMNNISIIENNTFTGLSNLEELYFGPNPITSIEVNAFAGLVNLWSLWLTDVNLNSHDSSVLQGLPMLYGLLWRETGNVALSAGWRGKKQPEISNGRPLWGKLLNQNAWVAWTGKIWNVSFIFFISIFCSVSTENKTLRFFFQIIILNKTVKRHKP